MWLLVIFITAAIMISSVIFGIVVTKKKNAERHKYYSAAANIVKEDLLNYSIKNNLSGCELKPSGERIMVYIKAVSGKNKNSYVFDPAKIIYIGRSTFEDKNSICLNDSKVSHNHCAIYSDGYNVFLQDMNSLNGSMIKRGLRKYWINNGNIIQIEDKDKLYIGSVILRITVFYYDSLTM